MHPSNIWLKSTLVVVFCGYLSVREQASVPKEHPIADPAFERNVQLATTAFRAYNPNITDGTIRNFCRIAKAYDLHEKDVFRKCVGQICLESKAKQSAISSGNARGMGQIVPTTAFDVLHKMSHAEFHKMDSLGASDIEWARKGRYSKRETPEGTQIFLSDRLNKKAVAWLSNETNNLLIWAHIMRKNSQEHGFDHALLSYRLGNGGAANYQGRARNHPYVKSIDRIGAKFAKKKKGAQ